MESNVLHRITSYYNASTDTDMGSHVTLCPPLLPSPSLCFCPFVSPLGGPRRFLLQSCRHKYWDETNRSRIFRRCAINVIRGSHPPHFK
jgi:hypothetical protein